MAEEPRLAGTHHHLSSNVKDLATAIGAYVGSTGIPSGATLEQVHVLESLTGLTDGALVDFPTANYFEEGSTRVFLAGLLMEPEIDWIEASTRDGVTLTVAPADNAQLAIEYIAEVNA